MLATDREYLAARERLTAATVGEVRRTWAQVGPDFDRGWPVVGPVIAALIIDGQEGAARDGAAYFTAALAEQGLSSPSPRMAPAAFTGAYSLDGGELGDMGLLTYGAVVHARAAQVGSLAERLDVGARWLGTVTQTQLAHAGRSATSTAITATGQAGWTRTVNPPCCRYCAVRAGTFHTWRYTFWQHPGCDCTRTPTTLDNLGQTATEIGPDDVTGLTDAQREAIREGADLGRVVNADRGVSDGRLTTTALARRGQRRLTPDGIYRIASDRNEARALLRRFGYLL